MKKYREVLDSVVAAQWNGTAAGATPIIDWLLSLDYTARFDDYTREGSCTINIDTLWFESMRVKPHEWVVVRPGGLVEVHPPDMFAATFQPEVEADA